MSDPTNPEGTELDEILRPLMWHVNGHKDMREWEAVKPAILQWHTTLTEQAVLEAQTIGRGKELENTLSENDTPHDTDRAELQGKIQTALFSHVKRDERSTDWESVSEEIFTLIDNYCQAREIKARLVELDLLKQALNNPRYSITDGKAYKLQRLDDLLVRLEGGKRTKLEVIQSLKPLALYYKYMPAEYVEKLPVDVANAFDTLCQYTGVRVPVS